MKKSVVWLLAVLTAGLLQAQSSMVHDGITRYYRVHLPSGYDPSIAYPLVFNLHGYTSNAMQQEAYSQMNQVADAEKFIVVYPDGVNNSWNVGFDLVQPYFSGINDVGFINALIDEMDLQYPIDPLRVFSCGMSNGGYMSYRLACELSHRIAAVASVTGSMTDSTRFYCQPPRPVPAMQVHGTTDPIVNYNGLFTSMPVENVVSFWVNYNQCTVPADTTVIPNTNTADNCTAIKLEYTNGSGGAEVWFYKIDNGGHTWPSGLIDIPSYGNTNRDFSASVAIWDFFSRFSLPLVGVKPEEAVQAKIFPNPVTDEIHLSLPGVSVPVEYRLTDVTGKIITAGTIEGSYLYISATAMAPGTYLVTFSNPVLKPVKLVKR